MAKVILILMFILSAQSFASDKWAIIVFKEQPMGDNGLIYTFPNPIPEAMLLEKGDVMIQMDDGGYKGQQKYWYHTKKECLDWIKENGENHRSYYIVKLDEAVAVRHEIIKHVEKPTWRSLPQSIQTAEDSFKVKSK